jgi:hypothetical protein
MTIEEARALREAHMAARRDRFRAFGVREFLAATERENAAKAAWDAVPDHLAEQVREEDMARAMREWEASR